MSTNGLHYHDTTERAIVLVKMVAENREGFTRREYEGDKAARCALELVGYPSEKEFTNMVSSNMIVNCPVMRTDIKTLTRYSAPTPPP